MIKNQLKWLDKRLEKESQGIIKQSNRRAEQQQTMNVQKTQSQMDRFLQIVQPEMPNIKRNQVVKGKILDTPKNNLTPQLSQLQDLGMMQG